MATRSNYFKFQNISDSVRILNFLSSVNFPTVFSIENYNYNFKILTFSSLQFQAYELSTLTGTQVMLLVASETGHVYTFATRKLQPMITSEAGKQLIQTCLNSPDPPSVGGGDQRMSATGFEETELSYNIADEDSKVRQLIYGHHGHAHLSHPQAPASHYGLEQSIMQSPYSGGQPSPLSHAQAYATHGGHAHHTHVPHVPHSTHSHMSHTHAQR